VASSKTYLQVVELPQGIQHAWRESVFLSEISVGPLDTDSLSVGRKGRQEEGSFYETVTASNGVTIRRLLLLFVTLLLLSGCPRFRKADTVLIPDGYVGWVRIEFNVRGEARFDEKGGRYVVSVPLSGILRTSSSFETGYSDDHYFYVNNHGERIELKESEPAHER
jgi:hypothetical protein